MAATFRSVAKTETASAASITATLPAGVQTGDVLVAHVMSRVQGAVYTPPSGWTEITYLAGTPIAGAFAARVYTATYTGGLSTTWGISPSERMRVDIFAYSGAGATSQGSAADTTALAVATAAVNVPAGALLLGLWSQENTGTAPTWTQSGAMTERTDDGASAQGMYVCGADEAFASATSSVSRTGTSTQNLRTSAFAVIIPASTGGVALVGTGADGTSTADAGPLSRGRLLVGTGADGSSTADAGALSLAHRLVGTGADGTSTADGVLSKTGGAGVALVGTGADGSSTADAALTVRPAIQLTGTSAGDSTADAAALRLAHLLVGTDATGDSYAGASLSGGTVEGATLVRLPVDGIALDLFTHAPGYPRWDQALWPDPGAETPAWSTQTWVESTCLVTSARWSWGANRALGVLSVAAGGPFLATTYDPDRQLDPSNVASPFGGSVVPGTVLRLRYGAKVIAWATLDELGYSVQAQEGRLQGFDAVGALLNDEVPVIVSAPSTLRAYARAYLALSQLSGVLTVEADPPEGDTAIGTDTTAPTGLVSVWQAIQTACQDALAYGWITPTGELRFRSHGDPIDRGLVLGFDGIPVGELVTQSNRDGILNRVIARDSDGTTVQVDDTESQRRYGVQILDRTARKVGGAPSWAALVLADRAFASLEYYPAAIVPVTAQQLVDLVDMGGIDVAKIRLDVPEPDVSVDVRAVGLQLEASVEGWVAVVVGYVSAVEWSGGLTPPPEPEPPDPEPPPTTNVNRSATSTKASRVSKTDTGAKYGAGAQDNIPVGYHSGWQDRMLVQFDVDFSGAVELVSATLRLRTSSQVYTGFGSNPRIRIQRITDSWNEGSASTPSSGNAVVWPGPTATATGEKTAYVSGNEGVQEDIDVTAIVRAWAPPSAGGSGQPNRGLRISGYNETNSANTTEFRSDDHATSGHRPQLLYTVKVLA